MRTKQNVASVLFGRARRLILGWLLGHPEETFFLRQLARQTGLSPGSVQRELEALVAAGLVTRTSQGRQVYFQADRQSPVFPELQSLFLKTAGAADVLREALRPLHDRISVALLYGSAARHELRNDSDIDLVVVGDVNFGEVVSATSGAQRVLGREINPTVYPPGEFKAKVQDGHYFLTSVLNDALVFVIGDRDDLERVGGTKPLVDSAAAHEARDHRSARGRRPRSEGQPRRRPQR